MDGATDQLLAYKGAAIVAVLVALFAAERLRPAARALGGWRRLARNAGLLAVNAGLSPLIVVPITAWAATAGLDWRPAWWGGAAGLALDIVLLDFWIYWWHRANHRVPLLWRFHEVHHLDATLDTTSALRFHFGEVLLSALVRAAVIIVLDVPLTSVLAFEALVLIAAIFHHSNVKLPAAVERALSTVIITPSIHWVHHHKRQRDTDSNYGTIFSFWDRPFGSRNPMARALDMPIGVEGRDEEPLPRLLIRPFLPRD